MQISPGGPLDQNNAFYDEMVMRQQALIASGYPAIVEPLEVHKLLKKKIQYPGPGAYEAKSDFKPSFKRVE